MNTDVNIRVGNKATIEVQWLIFQWLSLYPFEKVCVDTYEGIGVDVALSANGVEDDAIREIAESLQAWAHCLHIGKPGISADRLEIDISIDHYGHEAVWHYLRIPCYYDDGSAYREEWGNLNMKEGESNE